MKRSSVVTKIKNLVPGKWYEINLYVASTIPKIVQNNYLPSYAGFVFAKIAGVKDLKVLHLNEKQASWVPRTVEFQAYAKDAIIRFSANTPSDNHFIYAHIFIDHNSIKEVQAPIR